MARIHTMIALVLALAGAQAGAVQAPRYELVDLGARQSDNQSGASAINNAGEVVGYSARPDGRGIPVRFTDGRAERLVPRDALTYRSGSAAAISDAGHVTGWLFLHNGRSPVYLTHGGVTTLYDPPDGHSAQAHGVNSSGLVVGWHYPQQTYRAVTLQDGQWQDLPVPQPELASFAYAVNDAGQVAGHLGRQIDGVETRLGALWQDGALKETFGLPGSPYTLALAINRLGWVTGHSQVGRYLHQVHAYIHRDGVTIDLETHHGARSYGYAINASGEVVGDRVAGARSGIFLYSGGRMWWLAELLPASQQAAWRLVLAYGINDAGHVVGVAQNQQGGLRAVLLRRLPAQRSAR